MKTTTIKANSKMMETMKRYFLTLGVIAASILAFSSCNREEDFTKEPEKNKVIFTFTAEKAGEETKTAVEEGSSKASYLWTTEDQANMHLYLVNGEDQTRIQNSDLTFNVSSDHKTMTITAAVEEAESYTFRAVLAGAFSGSNNPQIKAVQNPATDNFDPTADLLVSDDLTTDSPSELALAFNRKAVINKMTLKNITPGEKVKSIVISSTKNLTGTFSNNAFNSGDKTIRLNYSSQPVVTGDFPVYFASIPNTGHELTVTVTTDQHKYTKTFGGSIAFNNGAFTRFSVGLPAGTAVDALEGYFLIMAYTHASPHKCILMNSTVTTNKYFLTLDSEVTKESSEVTYSDFASLSGIEDCYWDVESDGEGNYTLQNVESEEYLALTSDSNEATSSSEINNNTHFSIDYNSETHLATITSTAYDTRQLMHNQTSTNPKRFAFYKGTQNPVYLIPVYDDGLTGVTLSFSEAIVNKTTSDYSSFTGQTVTADPNVSAVTSSITYGMEGDAIGTVNASTGVVTLNGTAGTATVTAVFPGDATYRQASASYTINVTSATGVMYKIVTSLSGVTEGEYVIVNDGYYLPNAAATSAGPVKNNNTKVTIDGDYVINVSDEMTWVFSGTTASSMTIKSTIEGDYYLVVSGGGNTNLRVNTTTGRTWTVADYSGTSGAFSLKDNTNNRYCASYSTGSDWRSYNSYNAGNYGDGGRIYLYKLESGPAVTWNLASISITTAPTKTTYSAGETFDPAGMVVTGHFVDASNSSNTKDEAVTGYTISPNGALAVTDDHVTITYQGKTATQAITVNAAPVVTYDFETVAELNGLVESTSAEYSGYLTNAVVSFVPATNTAIVKDATGSVMFYKSGHGLKQGQTYTGAINVTAILYTSYNNYNSEVTAWDATFTGSESAVAPQSVTLSTLVDNYSTWQNAYVQVAGLTVTSVSEKNINVTDGTNSYVVYDNTSSIAVGTGDVITAIGTVTKHSTTEEIKVWKAADVIVTEAAPKAITFSQPTETGCSFTVKVGGSNITSGTTVASGTTVTLTATVGGNYSFDGWNVIGASVADASSTTTTFSMGTSAVSVSASFTEKGSTPQPKTLTFSLTSNPGGWPTANSTTLTDYTYNLNNVAYTFKLKNVKQNSGYLMLTSTAVLGLPAISGYKLVTVKASNSSGCSTATRVGISSSSSSASYISGGAYQTWSTTGSTYTYNLTSTSVNTVYYLYVTNKNAQVTSLELTYNPVN